jgi:hypothetical protein
MVYEFWDLRSHNLIDAFDSEHEALVSLREAVRKQGEHVVEFLVLVEDDDANDVSRVLFQGLELLERTKSVA